MFPLSTQIHIANDIAQGGAARLAGAEVPAFEAKERSLTEWIATTRATIAYLEALKPAQFEGSENKTITWQTRSSTKNMQGTAYLFHHVLPNVFFHVTTRTTYSGSRGSNWESRIIWGRAELQHRSRNTLAGCPHCWQYASMAIQINIRDVPEKVRDELAARAALQGKSMQEFLRAELERLAARPSIDAWLQQVRKRKRATQTRISSRQIIENKNADRR